MLIAEQPAKLILIDQGMGTLIFPNGFRTQIHAFPRKKENEIEWMTSDSSNTSGVSNFWDYARLLTRSGDKKIDVIIKSGEVVDDVPAPRLKNLHIVLNIPEEVEKVS